ncbi:MAG TPA: hypothetical protein VHX37_12205 [Acidobacteriaceae bacterium]|jgi:hypothetical protein|nr:hypothetical protein [Acidobacteriaceae bacterium]
MLAAGAGLILLPCGLSAAAVSQNASRISLRSDRVTVEYDRQAGSMEIVWSDGHRLAGITSGATLADGQVLSTASYASHTLEEGGGDAAHASSAGAREYTIRSTGAGLPVFLQHIWLYADQPWIVLQAELGPKASLTGTRHFDVVELQKPGDVQIGAGSALRMLHVPFDNDMWFRYDSMAVADMKPGVSYTSDEVTTLFDNATRQALVLGSVAHDVWKTAIEAHAADGQLSSLDIYGGIASPAGVRTDTHDTLPHGIVHGARVASPRIFIGSFSDWRSGLEAFGAANAAVHPPLVWPEGTPMGWNSWAAYGHHIDDQRYLGTAKFVQDVLVPQGFTRDKVIYINLDASWSNLDAVQLAAAVRTIRSLRAPDGTRFEPGIYWAPFAYFSSDMDAWVESTGMKYRYRDILLKGPDGSPLPKVDGGWPVDPTNPGEKERIAFTIAQFEKLGFRYVKLDFLSHGSIEGVHYDRAVQTGIEAYNEGMQEVVKAVDGKMFISLSIAPLFPSGYGDSRRISCDTKGHISGEQSTEYMLNSLTYGWWTSPGLYIIDPDHVALGVAADHGARSVVEGKSRLLSAIISGGMILDSSPVADNAQARQFASAVYDNRNLFAVASQARVFRPVEGDTGDRAGDAFERPSSDGVYLAVFNYDDQHQQTISVPLARISPSLAAASAVEVIDVASGKALAPARGEVSLTLLPAQSQLVDLRVRQ